MFGKKFRSTKIANKMFEYRYHINKKNILNDELIGGVKVILSELDGNDPSFKAYILQKGYENFYIAINRSRIPIMTIYMVLKNRSGIYILTKAKDEEELNKNIKIIETSFYAVFPKARLMRLSGREIKNILLFGNTKLDGESQIPVINYSNFGNGVIETNDTLPPFRIPTFKKDGESNIVLGRIISQYGEEEYPYTLSYEDISRHVICLGVTGSGKTTTVATILNKLGKRIKYLVFDFHNEYRELLNNYNLIVRPGVNDEYSINPLKPVEGIDHSEHLAMVTDIFADVYDFTHPQSYLFKMALEKTISEYKLYNEDEPNLEAFIKILENLRIQSYYEIETKAALIRRLKPLTQGQARKAFIGKNTIRIDELLNRNVIVELGGLREIKVRQIYSQLLLKQIYDYRTLQGPNELQHLITIEEASYIVPYRRDYDKPSIAERMVNEMRKFGESIILITQFPSQIPKDTVKNAGLLIIHRLTGLEDLRILQNIIPLEKRQVEFFKRLDRGYAVVKDPTTIEPFLVKIYPQTRTQGKNLDKSPFSTTKSSQLT